MSADDDQAQAFAAQAEQRQRGLVAELVAFVRENKKWVLIPILVVLLLVGVLVALAGTAAAPLIYPLF